jgi:hypothetical protein
MSALTPSDEHAHKNIVNAMKNGPLYTLYIDYYHQLPLITTLKP